jgi:ribose transport system permease protein
MPADATATPATADKAPDQPAAAPAAARLRRWFPLALLAALCLVFSLLSERFLSFGNLTIILQQSVVLLVAALGVTIIIMAGSIDLSVGSVVALSALATALTVDALGPWAIGPALLVGLLAGALNGMIVAWGKVPSFIVTLGAMVVYRGLVLYFTRGAPVSLFDADFLGVYAGRSFGLPHAALIALLAALLCHGLLTRTVFGREVKAVGAGERVAHLTGIPVARVKIAMFAVAGLLFGLAGLLQSARAMAATAQLGEGLELDVIAAVVVGGTPLTGGVGGVPGTILGVLIITILSNGMNMVGVDPYIQNIAKGVVLVVAVFVTIDRAKIGVIK